jgi:hypothetical protein
MFLGFYHSLIFSKCSFLHSITVGESKLLCSPNTVLYTTLCCSSIQPLEALKSSMLNLVAMSTAFSLSSVPNYCIDASSLFKPHGQQTLQFLKRWVFQALPSTREPATLFSDFPIFNSSVQC